MKISQEVLEVLSASEVNGTQLKLPGVKLERKLYQDVDKVLRALGGKWNTKTKSHIFEVDAYDLVDEVILSGEYVDAKKQWQQFDTNAELADRVVDSAQIAEGDKVLEPSCGVGNIVRAMLKKVSPASIHVFEIDSDRMDKCLAANFSEEAPPASFTRGDFLLSVPTGDFDAVAMNPPFAKGADIAHVLHAHRFLKRNGRLVSVMSAGIRFRQDKRTTAFRQFVEQHEGWFEDVDAGSFKESGTMANTVIVVIPN